MSATYKGSCLCGSIKFEIIDEFDSFYLCYCRYCKKDTGTAHAANLFTAPAKIKWLSGLANVKSFNLPATRHSKSFCQNCGSAVPHLEGEGDLLAVPAGSLDSDITITPNAHIFVNRKASWENKLERIPVFEELPG